MRVQWWRRRRLVCGSCSRPAVTRVDSTDVRGRTLYVCHIPEHIAAAVHLSMRGGRR